MQAFPSPVARSLGASLCRDDRDGGLRHRHRYRFRFRHRHRFRYRFRFRFRFRYRYLTAGASQMTLSPKVMP